jgi:hypothetical protein
MGVLFGDQTEERSGQIAESERLREISIFTKLSTNEASENGWDEGCNLIQLASTGMCWSNMGMYTHIRVHVEGLVLDQSLGHMHHLGKNEDILKAVRDLLGDELDKIWHQLVQTWILAQARVSGCTIILAGLMQESTADLLKVELKFS